MNNGARVLLLVFGKQDRRKFKAAHVTSMDIRHFPGTLRAGGGSKLVINMYQQSHTFAMEQPQEIELASCLLAEALLMLWLATICMSANILRTN